MRRLEIWAFKIVSFIALLSELIYLYVSRTPRLEVGADIYLRVWRRPQKSDNVMNPIIPSYRQLTRDAQLGRKRRRHLGFYAHADEQR